MWKVNHGEQVQVKQALAEQGAYREQEEQAIISGLGDLTIQS